MHVMILLFPLIAILRAADIASLDCELGISHAPSQPAIALGCADGFVKDNGYTTAAPTSDSTRLVPEFMEAGSTWSEVLAYRHATLVAGTGSPFCGDLRGTEGCMVSYEQAGTRGCRLRAVLMTSDYRALHMMHQDLGPYPRPPHCEPTQ